VIIVGEGGGAYRGTVVSNAEKENGMNKRHGLIVASVAAVLSAAVLAYAGARSDDALGIAVSPQMLLLGTTQSAVKVHTDIPYSSVAKSTLELNGLAASGSYADALGNLVAVFSESAVKQMVSPPSAVLTLTGQYLDGEPFSGSDRVMVTRHRGR
jgi:hypothetical protein